MRQLCFLLIVLHLSFSFTSGLHKQKHSDPNYKIDVKKQINDFCMGKYEDFCSVEHINMVHKIIDDNAKELKKRQMRKMKESIIKEITQNIQG
jgi:hypothetical protein